MRDKKIESWLDGMGVSYEYIDALPLTAINARRSEENRARIAGALIPTQIAVYATSIKSELFPPVLAIKNGKSGAYIADGNQRMAAAREVGLEKYPHGAYIIEANDVQSDLIIFTANDTSGAPLTTDDRVHHAVDLVIKHGWTGKAAASKMRISENVVNAMVRAYNFDERAGRLGAPTKNIQQSTKIDLMSIQSDSLFVQASVAVDANKMAGEDSRAMIKKIKSAPSESAAEKIIEAEKREARVVDRNTQTGKSRAKRSVDAVRRACRVVLNLKAPEIGMLRGELAEQSTERFRSMIAHIRECLRRIE